MKIPGDVLSRLPYNAFYMKLSDHQFNKSIIDGVFVCSTYDSMTKRKLLLFLMLGNDLSLTTLYYYTEADSLRRSYRWFFQGYERRNGCALKDLITSENDMELFLQNVELEKQELSRLLQLVLYLCSDTPDIQPHKQQNTYRPSSKTSDKSSEVREWDTGIRIGTAFRKQTQAVSAVHNVSCDSHRRGTPKRPHIRRGHFCFYWTGKRSDPEHRVRISKWIQPVFVNCNGSDVPAVIHEVNQS